MTLWKWAGRMELTTDCVGTVSEKEVSEITQCCILSYWLTMHSALLHAGHARSAATVAYWAIAFVSAFSVIANQGARHSGDKLGKIPP